MSLYVLVGNDRKSPINEVHTSYMEIIPPVFNQVNPVEWILENDAKNVINYGWQTITFVTMRLKYMKGLVYTSITII